MARLEFASDYMEGCIPEILTRLTETNLEKSSGYGVNFHQNGTPSPSKLVLRGEYFQHPHPVSPHPSHRISVLFGAAADLFLKL